MRIPQEIVAEQTALQRIMGELDFEDEKQFRKVQRLYQAFQALLVERGVQRGSNQYLRKNLWLAPEFKHYGKVRDHWRQQDPRYRERKAHRDHERHERQKGPDYYTSEAKAARAFRRRAYDSLKRFTEVQGDLVDQLLGDPVAPRVRVLWSKLDAAYARRHDFEVHPRLSFDLWKARVFLPLLERERRIRHLHRVRDSLFEIIVEHPERVEEITRGWTSLEEAYLHGRELLDQERYPADFSKVRPVFERLLHVRQVEHSRRPEASGS